MTRTRRSVLLALATAPALALPALPAVAKDKDCNDFKTQRQAQRFFKKHDPKRDPHNLDSDNDGKACENLPRR